MLTARWCRPRIALQKRIGARGPAPAPLPAGRGYGLERRDMLEDDSFVIGAVRTAHPLCSCLHRCITR